MHEGAHIELQGKIIGNFAGIIQNVYQMQTSLIIIGLWLFGSRMWKTQGLCQRPLSQIAVSAQSRRPLACFLRSRAGASAIILVAAARNVNSVFPSQGGGRTLSHPLENTDFVYQNL